MGLFDVFTGAPAVNAANQNQNILGQTQQNILTGNNNVRGNIQDFIQQGYGNANSALGTGYNASTGAINTGANSALGYLDTGANNALGALNNSAGAFGNLAANYGQGAGLYADALGINGAAGNARAQSAFTSSPGYDYQLNQGIDAINRRANAAGMLQGGNANRDAISFASNLANQNYGNWLNNLSGYNGLQLNATQGGAGVNSAIANLYNQSGQNKANVATGQGSSLANLAQQYYGGVGSNDIGQAGALSNDYSNANQTGINSILNLTPQVTKQNTDAANAQIAGSGNLVNFGLQVAKLAAGAAGGAAGGGFGSGFGGGSFGGAGGNLGPSGFLDPSMWNKQLPANGFNFG